MLRFLFPRLTPGAQRGTALFAWVTGRAREPHWYVAGEVPDTIEGRFRMLATVAALVAVRLEQSGDKGEAASVALTERFIEAMDGEHRQMGLGDPALGRAVRRLVGGLARRVELWREAASGEVGWNDAAQESVYSGEVAPAALAHTAAALGGLWSELQAADIASLEQGQIA